MARLNITIPDELSERVERWRDRLNLSRVCQEAISRELDRLEQIPSEVKSMHKALARLGREKAKVEQSSFRKGVHDGLEWARGAEYGLLKRWGERNGDAVLHDVLRGPASELVAGHQGDPTWDPEPYAEGWIAGVQQFWERAKKRL
jgi:hypothetical protein